MDVLELRKRKSKEFEFEVVDIYINNRNLLDILKKVELPYALAEGKDAVIIAGNYEGLPAEDIFYPSRHIWGEALPIHEYVEGKISLLDCNCGCYGCWPFQVKISLHDDRVIWSDFEQPHRSLENWTYKELSPFIFDIKQYEMEWKKLVKGDEKNIS